MKKFNRLICAGVFAVFGLCSIVNAADSNIQIREYNNDALSTQSLDVVFFNNYIENTVGEIFSGSSTTSGGTSTFSRGVVDVSGWTGNKDFGLSLAPVGAGGSITVTYYGVNGTTTAGAGTDNAYVLAGPVAYNVVAGTSASFSTALKPTLIACSVNVTAGTVNTFLGMHTNKAK